MDTVGGAQWGDRVGGTQWEGHSGRGTVGGVTNHRYSDHILTHYTSIADRECQIGPTNQS